MLMRMQFYLAYRSLCPSGWYNRKFHFSRAMDVRVMACDLWAHAAPCPPGEGTSGIRDTDPATGWDEQREAGNFPAKLDA